MSAINQFDCFLGPSNMKAWISGLGILGCLCGLVSGQEPDFEAYARTPLVPAAKVQLQPWEMARTRLFCDGTHINLLIEVKDEEIVTTPEREGSDRLEVWLALPREAYPSDFEYQFHPTYISRVHPGVGRGSGGALRVFSLYSEYGNRVDLNTFRDQYDYPADEEIFRRQLDLPVRRELGQVAMPFGMVHFALYPDNREAEWIGEGEHALWENLVGARLGPVSSGIIYTVDKERDGYIINAQISPEALGFVSVPRLEGLRIRIDWYNRKERDHWLPGGLTTAASPEVAPGAFSPVRMLSPLRTNFTGIPDDLFGLLDWHPLGIFTQNGWITAAMRVEGLLFDQGWVSRYLTQIDLFPMPFSFQQDFAEEGNHKLSWTLNKAPGALRQESLVLPEGIFQTIQFAQVPSYGIQARNQVFRFPDGETGLILIEQDWVDPKGLNGCAGCTQETLSIFRLEDGIEKELVKAFQGGGEEYYCEIGPLNFPGYFISSLDWIRPGRVLLLRLDHPESPEKKRVKISWDKNGERLKVVEIN